MTLVAQGNGWHIESFVVARASIAAGLSRSTTHTLTRPGVFIGGSATLDMNLTSEVVDEIALEFTDSDGTQLELGQDVSAVATEVWNSDASAAIVGEMCFVFVRDHR